MRSTLEALEAEFSALRMLVSSIDSIASLIRDHGNSDEQNYITLRRRFENSSFIIGLYASYEKFSEELMISFSSILASNNDGEPIPAPLLKKHTEKTIEILFRGYAGKGRFSNITEIDLVKNLFNCLNGNTPRKLNELAITSHEANLRFDSLVSLFEPAGINCRDLVYIDPLVKWYNRFLENEENSVGFLPESIIKSKLDELVESRNNIAHRGGNPDNLLGPQDMNILLDFMENLAESIFIITVSAYMQQRSKESDVTHLHITEGPFQKGLICVVKRPDSLLFVGQPIFVTSPEWKIRWGRIKDIQLDGNSVIELHKEDHPEVESVGICVDFRIPKHATLSVLQSEDELVWTPIEKT